MDKSLSLPFSVSESFTVEPLAKIHCDLWGPSPIEFVQESCGESVQQKYQSVSE